MQINDELLRLGLLAGTMGSGARIYHTGFIVPDIDDAVSHLGSALGITFTPPTELPYTTFETPDGPVEAHLRLAYSTRPAHLELIGSAPGSMYDFATSGRGHHIGVWTDDIAAEAERLDALGMPRLWWGRNDDGSLAFTFHDTPYGFLIELVDSAARPLLPEWFSAVDPSLMNGENQDD